MDEIIAYVLLVGILFIYVIGFLAVVTLFIIKLSERRREKKIEKEKFDDYKDY